MADECLNPKSVGTVKDEDEDEESASPQDEGEADSTSARSTPSDGRCPECGRRRRSSWLVACHYAPNESIHSKQSSIKGVAQIGDANAPPVQHGDTCSTSESDSELRDNAMSTEPTHRHSPTESLSNELDSWDEMTTGHEQPMIGTFYRRNRGPIRRISNEAIPRTLESSSEDIDASDSEHLNPLSPTAASPKAEGDDSSQEEAARRMYTPTNGDWQIRIIALLPGSFGENLKAELHVVDVILNDGVVLHDRPERITYSALSYCWRT